MVISAILIVLMTLVFHILSVIVQVSRLFAFNRRTFTYCDGFLVRQVRLDLFDINFVSYAESDEDSRRISMRAKLEL